MTDTATTTTPRPAPKPTRTLRWRGREIPVVLPNRRDPRLKLSATIMTLQVLGQTLLDFKLSIAQILVTIGVCAVVDVTVTYRSQHMLVWPASAILTGNSVSFILRASGTQHGDWWSLHGIQFFVLAALISLLVKYLVRPGGRHLFNPSNVGIVWVLLVIGPKYVFPQYLWWGPDDLGVALSYAVILIGAFWILRRLEMLPMAFSFLATFAVVVALLALAGREFIAVWHDGPISGVSYWWNIAFSPEVLVFVFFMISDPQTAPKSAQGRIVYGVGTALTAAGLLSFQSTEYGIKLGILSSLTVTCALVPGLEYLLRRREQRRNAAVPAEPVAAPPVGAPRWRRLVLRPAIVAAGIIALAAPVDTLRLVGNDQLTAIELGQTTSNPQ